MESLNPLVGVGTTSEASAGLGSGPTSELGREEFLKLLIAQLENQDPLQPAQDTEFVAQLATFSSLEQLISVNDQLGAIDRGQLQLINSQALELIGKHALVESGGDLRVSDGTPESLVYVIPRPVQSATLRIFGRDGSVIRSIPLQTTPSGQVRLEWDGLDSEGEPVADGTFEIDVKAVDGSGEAVPVALYKSVPIDGVNFDSNGVSLVSADREIPFELIVGIRNDN